MMKSMSEFYTKIIKRPGSPWEINKEIEVILKKGKGLHIDILWII